MNEKIATKRHNKTKTKINEVVPYEDKFIFNNF